MVERQPPGDGRLRLRIRLPPSRVGSAGCSSKKSFFDLVVTITALRRMPMELHRPTTKYPGSNPGSSIVLRGCSLNGKAKTFHHFSRRKKFTASSAKTGYARAPACWFRQKSESKQPGLLPSLHARARAYPTTHLCPSGSGRRFQEMLPAQQTIRWLAARPLFLGSAVALVFAS